MLGWLRKLLRPKIQNWTCEMHGNWVMITENNKPVYSGEKDDMPRKVRRKWKKNIEAIESVWNL